MRNYHYKIIIRNVYGEIRFNSNSIQYINKRLKKFILFNGVRLNVIIRNYHTNDVIQDSSIYQDLSILNRLNCSFKLVKHNNNYYFVNHEKNKICK